MRIASKALQALILSTSFFALTACLSGGGGGSDPSARLLPSPDETGADPITNWTSPTTVSAAETALRGDWYSTRDADNYLKVDNQGNWSFQLESGYYRVVNGSQVLTPYTYQSGGKTPIADSLTNGAWLIIFDVDTYPQYAPFDGVYDDTHNNLAIEFTSENCILIRVRALNQAQYDTYCKQ